MKNGNYKDINSKESNQQKSTLYTVTKIENSKIKVFG